MPCVIASTSMHMYTYIVEKKDLSTLWGGGGGGGGGWGGRWNIITAILYLCKIISIALFPGPFPGDYCEFMSD